MDDTIQIKCPRCKARFRERARRLTNGFNRQCPGCEKVLFFDEDSAISELKKPMIEAKRLRRLLALDVAETSAKSARFSFGRASELGTGDEQ